MLLAIIFTVTLVWLSVASVSSLSNFSTFSMSIPIQSLLNTFRDALSNGTPFFSFGSLPRQSYDSDLVIVLDLDECLIHTCGAGENEAPADNVDSFICQFRGRHRRRVLLRPGCEEFLNTILARYETHIFTASYSDYAIPIITELENRVGKRFAGYLFRDSCTEKKYMQMLFTSKDLRRLRRGQDMRRILLVDNDPTNFEPNPDNGIPVRSFLGDKNDKTLVELSELVQELEAVEDVRTVLKERFKLGKIFDVSKEIFHPLHLQWEHVHKCAVDIQL